MGGWLRWTVFLLHTWKDSLRAAYIQVQEINSVSGFGITVNYNILKGWCRVGRVPFPWILRHSLFPSSEKGSSLLLPIPYWSPSYLLIKIFGIAASTYFLAYFQDYILCLAATFIFSFSSLNTSRCLLDTKILDDGYTYSSHSLHFPNALKSFLFLSRHTAMSTNYFSDLNEPYMSCKRWVSSLSRFVLNPLLMSPVNWHHGINWTRPKTSTQKDFVLINIDLT